MANLSKEVQTYIVQQLACYYSPQEVSVMVKENFEIDVPRTQVNLYDASKPYFQHGKKWKDLFHATRAEFLKQSAKIPILNKSFRGAALQKAYDKLTANERGANWKLVLEVLEMAAKEEGGIFTNRRELTGANGKDLLPAQVAREVLKEIIADGIDQREAIDFVKERYQISEAELISEAEN